MKSALVPLSFIIAVVVLFQHISMSHPAFVSMETSLLNSATTLSPAPLKSDLEDIISIARGGQGGMQDDVLGLVHSQAPARQPSICSDPSYSELIDVQNRKRRPSFCLAVWLGHDVSPGVSGVPRGAFLRCIGADTLPKAAERRWFLQTYSGCPPPLLMPTLTVLQVLLFLYYMAGWEKFPYGILNYRPRDLYQPWRLVTYALLHQGPFEMAICILAQLVVALPLEIVHGSPRIGLIYVAGVFAGSSITSTIDPEASLLGAAGGTFALLSAHLGTIVMNTSHVAWVFRLPQLLTVLLLMSVEFGRAVWRRMLPPAPGVPVGPSFMAHGAGVVVGISLGLVVLLNFGQRLRDCSAFWATFGVYIIVTMTAVICSFLC